MCVLDDSQTVIRHQSCSSRAHISIASGATRVLSWTTKDHNVHKRMNSLNFAVLRLCLHYLCHELFIIHSCVQWGGVGVSIGTSPD